MKTYVLATIIALTSALKIKAQGPVEDMMETCRSIDSFVDDSVTPAIIDEEAMAEVEAELGPIDLTEDELFY